MHECNICQIDLLRLFFPWSSTDYTGISLVSSYRGVRLIQVRLQKIRKKKLEITEADVRLIQVLFKENKEEKIGDYRG